MEHEVSILRKVQGACLTLPTETGLNPNEICETMHAHAHPSMGNLRTHPQAAVSTLTWPLAHLACTLLAQLAQNTHVEHQVTCTWAHDGHNARVRGAFHQHSRPPSLARTPIAECGSTWWCGGECVPRVEMLETCAQGMWAWKTVVITTNMNSKCRGIIEHTPHARGHMHLLTS